MIFLNFNRALSCISRSIYFPQTHLNPASKCVVRNHSDESHQNVAIIPLSHRSVVKLSGSDSANFLQGLVTNDVDKLSDNKCMYAAMLNNKGRVMHDLIMYWQEDDNSILLECQTDSRDAFLKTLKLYKLKKKVDIVAMEALSVWQVQILRSFTYGSFENVEELSEKLTPKLFKHSIEPLLPKSIVTIHPDPRLSWLGWRVISNSGPPCPNELISPDDTYHTTRHFYGIPEGPDDLLPGKSLPLESNIDFMNGISFDKGCYLGQELTARSHFTGVQRKRLMPIIIPYTDKTIQKNASLYDQKGKLCGKYRSSFDGRFGLALINIDRQNVRISTSNGIQLSINKTYWWPTP